MLLTRSTRSLAGIVSAATLALVLAACGGEQRTATEGGVEGLDAVSISGDVGKAPKVEWNDRMTADEAESEVIVEGDGPAVEKGDSVMGYLWMANGFTQRTAYDGYERGLELFTASDEQAEYFKAIEGAKIGSRIAVTVGAETAFGESGNPDFGIANSDSVLFVLDLVAPVADAPEGEEQPAPAWAPEVQTEKGDPNTVTGLSTDGAAAPAGGLRTAAVIKGTGPEVEPGQTVAVRYLGRTAEEPEPFDENFSSRPTAFKIGGGSVIKGWDQGLAGQTVGSRVILSVPPRLGYGKKGSGETIPPDSHLYFVVDILGAY